MNVLRTTNTVVLLLVFMATAANAQSLVRRAAEIFENGCLSQVALSLGNGSAPEQGAGVVQAVGSVFLDYDNRGASRDLVGTPRYSIDSRNRTATFSCYVGSKNLTARQLVRQFDRLSRTAAGGATLPPIEPAQIDGDTTTFVEGQRRVFSSNGRTLILEAIFYQSDRGPVGAFSMSIEHRTGN